VIQSVFSATIVSMSVLSEDMCSVAYFRDNLEDVSCLALEIKWTSLESTYKMARAIQADPKLRNLSNSNRLQISGIMTIGFDGHIWFDVDQTKNSPGVGEFVCINVHEL
jgi:hypothetical protein